MEIMNNKCLQCGKETYAIINSRYKDKVYSYRYAKKKFCSYKCYHSHAKGKPLTGRCLEASRISIKKAIDARKNNPEIRTKWLEKMRIVNAGSKNWRWISDRSKLVNQNERNNYKYIAWTISVKKRDNYKCRIPDINCNGRLEVHHILGWTQYVELRYKINNGITLCHAHHPRARSEEKRLIPFFQELVSVSN